jgi:hypothetical protein
MRKEDAEKDKSVKAGTELISKDLDTNNKNRSKKLYLLVFLALSLALFGVTTFLLLSQKKNTNSNIAQINTFSEKIPAENQSQVEWAKVSAVNLKKSDLAKTSDKTQQQAYYRQLFMYYTISQDITSAVNDYTNEVTKKGVYLEPGQLDWLAGYFLSRENTTTAKKIYEDEIIILTSTLKNSDYSERENQTIKNKITLLKGKIDAIK